MIFQLQTIVAYDCRFDKFNKKLLPKYYWYPLQYDSQIDSIIIKLLNLTESMTYLDLKRRIERSLDPIKHFEPQYTNGKPRNIKRARTISFETYNLHLEKMIRENILEKRDSGKKGKPVFYSLTKQFKKQVMLNTLGLSPKQ